MKEYPIAVALIVATGTEEAAVKMLYDWIPVTFQGDHQTYYQASFIRNDRTYRIVYARQETMGMTVGVTLTMKIITHFHPQYLIMVGIAAGIALSDVAEQIYGDVVVADMVWNYSSGKFVSPDWTEIRFGNVGFLPRHGVVNIREDVLQYVIGKRPHRRKISVMFILDRWRREAQWWQTVRF